MKLKAVEIEGGNGNETDSVHLQ